MAKHVPRALLLLDQPAARQQCPAFTICILERMLGVDWLHRDGRSRIAQPPCWRCACSNSMVIMERPGATAILVILLYTSSGPYMIALSCTHPFGDAVSRMSVPAPGAVQEINHPQALMLSTAMIVKADLATHVRARPGSEDETGAAVIHSHAVWRARPLRTNTQCTCLHLNDE